MKALSWFASWCNPADAMRTRLALYVAPGDSQLAAGRQELPSCSTGPQTARPSRKGYPHTSPRQFSNLTTSQQGCAHPRLYWGAYLRSRIWASHPLLSKRLSVNPAPSGCAARQPTARRRLHNSRVWRLSSRGRHAPPQRSARRVGR